MTWKQTIIAAFLTLATSFGATSWAQEKPGKIHIDFAWRRDPDLKRVEFGLEASATEIYFGDAVYFRAFDRNASETPVYRTLVRDSQIDYYERFTNVDFGFFSEAVFSADGVAGTYSWAPEFPKRAPEGVWRMGGPLWTEIPPGAERDYGAFAVEFPPLEDWDDPFWRGVRKRLATQERVELRARFHFERTLKTKPRTERIEGEGLPSGGIEVVRFAPEGVYDGVVEKKIVLKRRPSAEMKRLDGWFEATPSGVFPERNESEGKAPRTEPTRLPDRRDVEIAGKKYNPWLVVRYGNRKPADPNNPTTLDGWRELEAEFSPSTLRDEITLTRLQLEYYNAATEAEAETALKTLVAWLDALPGPQRAAMIASITSRRWIVGGLRVGMGRTPVDSDMQEIAPKYERLCDALVPPVEPTKPEPIPIDVERLAEVARRAVEEKAASVPAPAVETVASFDGRLETTLETSPTSELLFGDSLYCRLFDRNVSDAPLTVAAFSDAVGPPSKADLFYSLESISLESDEFGRYDFALEFAVDWGAKTPERTPRTLDPGAEREIGRFVVEFPPSEDLGTPFWKTVWQGLQSRQIGVLRESLGNGARGAELRSIVSATSGVDLRLRVAAKRWVKRGADWEAVDVVFERKLTLKPRAVHDFMARVEGWGDHWKPGELPRIVERDPAEPGPTTYKLPALEASEACVVLNLRVPPYWERGSCIFFEKARCDRDFFARVGARKQRGPHGPDATEWGVIAHNVRESTLRDDFELISLQLKFYEARDGEKTQEALETLVDWLAGLPRPQRLLYLESTKEKRAATVADDEAENVKSSEKIWVVPAAIAEKYERLCAALEEITEILESARRRLPR